MYISMHMHEPLALNAYVLQVRVCVHVFVHRKHWQQLTRVNISGHSCPGTWVCSASQRSLHNAPIFRLLLKVAVNGTHQCDFLNFCGGLGPQHILSLEIARNIMLTYFFSLFGLVTKSYTRTLLKIDKCFFHVWNHPCGRGNSAISDA